MRRFLFQGLLLLGLIILTAIPAAIAQDDGDTATLSIEVLDEPQVAFPNVAVELRVLDNGRSVGGLDVEDFEVDDSVQAGSLTLETNEVSTNLAVIVDVPTGQTTEFERPLAVVRGFFEDSANYEDGTSVVFVLARNNTLEVDVYTDRASILARIDSVTSGDGQANPLTEALQLASDELFTLSGDGGNGNILLVSPLWWNSRFINNAPETAAQIFAERGYQINVVQAYTGSRQSQEGDYLEIAEAGGGVFAALGPGDDFSNLDPVYEAMQSGQASYTLRYTTESTVSGVRTVTVSAALPSGTATGQFSYEGPASAPPTVEFFAPAAGTTIERNAIVRGASFDVNTFPITITISDVEDGVSLAAGRVEVIVDGAVVETLTFDPDNLNPGAVEASWSLIENFGLPTGEESITRNVELRVVLTDSFNREIEATQSVTVVTRIQGATAAASSDDTVDDDASTDVSDTPEPTEDTESVAIAEANAAATSLAATATAFAVDADSTVDNLSATATAVAVSVDDGTDDEVDVPSPGIAGDFTGNTENDAAAIIESANATATAAALAVAESIEAANAAVEEADDSGENNSLVLFGGVAAASLLFLSIIGFIVLRGRSRRRRQYDDDPNAGYADPAMGSMKTMIGGAQRQVDHTHAYLEVLSGDQSGRDIAIDQNYFTIGREMSKGIHYATPTYDNVSSRHCSIIRRGNSYFIEDHGSTNGTFVNGQKVTPNVETSLPPQATIQLGHDSMSSIRLRFKPQGAVTPSAGKTRVDMRGGVQGGAAASVDNSVWDKKTQMYGDAGGSSSSAPGNHQQAAPGQFFNPSAPQQSPPPRQSPPPNYRQKGNLDSWTNVPNDDDDSWLNDK